MKNDTTTQELKQSCLRMAVETKFIAGFEKADEVIDVAESYYQYITQKFERIGTGTPTYTGPIASQLTS